MAQIPALLENIHICCKWGMKWRESGEEKNEQERNQSSEGQGVSQVCHHLATVRVCVHLFLCGHSVCRDTPIYSIHIQFHYLSRPLDKTTLADCQTAIMQMD